MQQSVLQADTKHPVSAIKTNLEQTITPDVEISQLRAL
jgi:hypothetical protein